MENRIKKFLDAEQNAGSVPYNDPPHPEDGNTFGEYKKVCLNCGSDQNLKIYAHGNNAKEMVGMLILCNRCQEHYAGKNIRVDINIKEK